MLGRRDEEPGTRYNGQVFCGSRRACSIAIRMGKNLLEKYREAVDINQPISRMAISLEGTALGQECGRGFLFAL